MSILHVIGEGTRTSHTHTTFEIFTLTSHAKHLRDSLRLRKYRLLTLAEFVVCKKENTLVVGTSGSPRAGSPKGAYANVDSVLERG
eukprot:742479-Pyramimonas_sp.AAC.2